MDSARTNKLVSRYESGLVTAVEVANTLLHDLVLEADIDTRFFSSIDSLPEEVVQAFDDLLRRIEENGFQWAPFVLRSIPVPVDPTAYSPKLRRICALLH